MDNENKVLTDKQKENLQLLKNYGLFFAIIIFILSILILTTLLSRKSWEEGLRTQVQTVLHEEKNDYNVGAFIRLDSPLSTSCAAYKINQKDKSENHKFAVVVRLTTYYGQIPAVYIYDSKSGDVNFLKLLLLDGVSEKQIVEISRNLQISFWAKRIPVIMTKIYNEKKERK